MAKILILEADPAAGAILRTVARDLRHSFVLVESSSCAAAVLNIDQGFDLIIGDMDLLGELGHELDLLSPTLRYLSMATPILATTTASEEVCRRHHAGDYMAVLRKPLEAGAMRKIIGYTLLAADVWLNQPANARV